MEYLVLVVFATILAPKCLNADVNDLGGSSSEVSWIPLNKQYLPPTTIRPVIPSHGRWEFQGYKGPIGVPQVLSDGTIADTPEVTAARSAHLAAIEYAKANNPDMDDGKYDHHKYGDDHYDVVSQVEDLGKTIHLYQSLTNGYHTQVQGDVQMMLVDHIQEQPSAGTQSTSEGWISTNAEEGEHSYEVPAGQIIPYSGPLAMIEVLPTGYVADFPEVTAARKTHMNAVNYIKAAEKLWNEKKPPHQPWN